MLPIAVADRRECDHDKIERVEESELPLPCSLQMLDGAHACEDEADQHREEQQQLTEQS